MEIQAQDVTVSKKHKVSFTNLIETNEFRYLLDQKKAFIVPMIIFFFVFYFTLPTLAAYTKLLNTPAFGYITWAWIFALAQFVLVWVGGIIYMRKSKQYDMLAEKILSMHKEELD